MRLMERLRLQRRGPDGDTPVHMAWSGRILILAVALAVAGCSTDGGPDQPDSAPDSPAADAPEDASAERQPAGTTTTATVSDENAPVEPTAQEGGAQEAEAQERAEAPQCEPCEASEPEPETAEPAPELEPAEVAGPEPLFGDAAALAGRTVVVDGELRYGDGALFSPEFKVIQEGPGTVVTPIELSVRHDSDGTVDLLRLRMRGDLVLLGRNLGSYEAVIGDDPSSTFLPVELTGARAVDAATGDEFLQALVVTNADHAFGAWVQLIPPGVLGGGIGSIAGMFAGGLPTLTPVAPEQPLTVYEGTMSLGYIGADGGASLGLADARVEIDAATGTGRLTTSNSRLTAGISAEPIDASTLNLDGSFALVASASTMGGRVTNAGDAAAGASAMEGPLDVRFYGPAGAELAGTLSLDGEGVEGIIGSFGLTLRSDP